MKALTVLAITIAAIACWALDVAPPPCSVCNWADTPPAIDGDISDAVWQKSADLGPFVCINPLSMPEERTDAFVLWDDDNIYVAFDCRESQMDKLVAVRSGRDAEDSWEDDCVEVFIAPRGPEEPYYHFILTAAGSVLDERGGSQGELDKSYNASLVTGVRHSAKGWTAEMAIPFADLGGTPELGDQWRINFNREEKPRGEWSGWAITTGTFHHPNEFGTIRFGDGGPIFAVGDLGGLFYGSRIARLLLRGGTVAGAHLAKISALYKDGHLIEHRQEQANVRAVDPEDVEIPYQVLVEGDCALSLAMVDTGGMPVFRTAAFPFTVPPLKTTLEELRPQLNAAVAQADALPRSISERRDLIASAEQISARVREQLAWVSAQTKLAHPDRKTWNDAYAQALQLQRKLNRLKMRLAAYAAQPHAAHLDYAVGIESPLKKVLRDEPFEGEIASVAKIEAAKNEYEPTQIVIVPFDKPLRDVRVTWTDLERVDGGHRLDSSLIDVKRVGYVRTRGKTSADVEYVGWWPDPLMPLEPFDVEPNQNQPLWVTVHVPPGQPAGVYVGELTIKPANSDPSKVRLEVEVWDFELPKQTHLRTAFHLGEPVLAQWYGYKELPQDFRRRWYQFLLDHRISPSTLYSGEPLPRMEDLGWCIERGLNTFNLGYIGEGKTTDEWLAWLKQYCAELREKGWLKYAYVYGFDEVKPNRYKAVAREYGRIHEAVPDLKRGCTVVPNDELDPYMDIWVPLTAHLDPMRAARQQKAGDEIWWYVCIGPQHPHANWFIDYPAIEPRILFWMTHKYHVTGFLYYYLNLWNSNMNATGGPGGAPPIEDNPTWLENLKAGKRWPEIEWNCFTFNHANGDGHLIYPGLDGQPISSIRFECIRDGIEDYEMLWLLDDLIGKLRKVNNRVGRYNVLLSECVQLSAVRPRVVRDLTHFTHDPQQLAAERGKVARQVMRVKRVLKRESLGGS